MLDARDEKKVTFQATSRPVVPGQTIRMKVQIESFAIDFQPVLPVHFVLDSKFVCQSH